MNDSAVNRFTSSNSTAAHLSFTLIKTYMIIYLYLLLHCSILEILLDHFVISSKRTKVYIRG